MKTQLQVWPLLILGQLVGGCQDSASQRLLPDLATGSMPPAPLLDLAPPEPPPPVIPAISCAEPHWAWENPTPDGYRYQGLWGSSARDIWTAATGGRIYHFDGSSWQCVQRLGQEVFGIAGCGSRDVWIVGNGGAVLHYDGTSFTPVSSGTVDRMESVYCAAPGNVFVLGDSSAILRSSGGALVPDPAAPDFHAQIGPGGLWGTGPSDVWVVRDANHTNQLAHYDGTSWTKLDGGPGRGWFAVRGTGPRDVWAAGRGALAHYDGTSLHPVSSPTFYIFDLWPSTPNDVWVAGPSSPLYHYDGSSFTPGPDLSGNSLWGASGDDVWLAGMGLYHSAGAHGSTPWQRLGRGPLGAISQLWGTSSTDLWAVVGASSAGLTGGAPELYHSDGTGWTAQPPPMASAGPSTQFNSIWGSGPKDIWLSATPAALFHYDGKSWTEIPAAVAGEHAAAARIFGTSASDVWIGGTSSSTNTALIKHFDGSTWKNYAPAGTNITDIFGARAGDVWAGVTVESPVGTPAKAIGLLHFDGAAWTPVTGLPDDNSGKRLWGSAPNDIWAVSQMYVLHYDGTSWRDAGSAAAGALPAAAIWGSGAADVWLVNFQKRSVWHFDGAWHGFPLDIYGLLTTVFGVGPGKVWLGGDYGMVLRYVP